LSRNQSGIVYQKAGLQTGSPCKRGAACKNKNEIGEIVESNGFYAVNIFTNQDNLVGVSAILIKAFDILKSPFEGPR